MIGAPFGRADGNLQRSCAQLDSVLPPPDDGSGLGRPDAVSAYLEAFSQIRVPIVFPHRGPEFRAS
jgi:hypothetical protein